MKLLLKTDDKKFIFWSIEKWNKNEIMRISYWNLDLLFSFFHFFLIFLAPGKKILLDIQPSTSGEALGRKLWGGFWNNTWQFLWKSKQFHWKALQFLLKSIDVVGNPLIWQEIHWFGKEIHLIWEGNHHEWNSGEAKLLGALGFWWGNP